MSEVNNTSNKLNFNILKRLLSYLKPYPLLIFLAATGIVFSISSDLLTPVILQQTLDNYVLPDEIEISMEKDERLAGIIKNSVYYLLLLAGSLAFTFMQVYFTARVGQKIMKDLRMELYDHLVHQSLNYLGNRPVGSLVSRIASDVETVNEFFSAVAGAMIKDISLLVGIVLTLFLMDWQLALIVIASLPPVILLTLYFRDKIRKVYRKVQSETSELNSYLSERVSGIEVVKAFNQEGSTSDEFETKNRNYFKASIAEVYTYGTFRPLVNFLSSVSIGALLFFGFGLQNSGLVSIGVLVAFVSLVEKFYNPLKDMSDKITLMQSAMAGCERVFELLDEEDKIDDIGTTKLPAKIKGDLSFKNVHFSYKKDQEILKKISFDIDEGSTVAIVGTTGAGKTTIASLLTRFWDINSGEITLDGVDIRNYPLKDLRRTVQAVQQDVTLFSGTIRENITLGKEIDDETIWKAVEFVHADGFIKSLPDGLDHKLTESASNISTGQRQLLSFARLLVYNPSIIILDEATSNIDTETEQAIQQGMENLLKDRTAMVIAHRLSTIKNADKILVLGHGKLIEEGNHEDLIAAKGVYYNLYKMQYNAV